jgi:uncharacterized circularly permuted ATP-grasp superfamily protein
MIEDAINHYHDLLSGALAADAQERLGMGTKLHQLYFGDRPVCGVLRPLFVTAAQYEYIRRESELVLAAIARLGQALLADAELRAELDLTAAEERIIEIEPGYAGPDASGRLDAFLDFRGDFGFVEYNAESPGGLLFGDVLGDLFREMEVVREFARRYRVRRIPVRPRILATLLESYREWGGRERPHIAIVDWREAKTYAEFELCREFFEAKGYRAIIADPRELELADGRLRAGDFEIDLVYKRVVTGELLQRGGVNQPLVRAARARAVCVVNSFRVQMLFKKALFALLDDPAREHLFTAEEIAALRRHIPWTRRLREGWTTYRGRRVDLPEFVIANRERLALKPNGEYGGRGVTLGWECEESRWAQTVNDALGASFVVQERVEVRREPFPALVNGRIEIGERFVDFDPYVWRGQTVAGAGVRLSSSALLNVSAGGGSATPLLIIEGAAS